MYPKHMLTTGVMRYQSLIPTTTYCMIAAGQLITWLKEKKNTSHSSFYV